MKETEQPEGPQIRHIDMSTAKFKANGNTYYIQSRLSVARYKTYNIGQLEVSHGLTFEQLYHQDVKMHELVTHGNDTLQAIHQVAETLFHRINLIVDFTNGSHPPILRFCALFINAEGEDIGVWDERIVDQKINDWTEEGLCVDDFFYLAANFIPSFRDAYRSRVLKQEEKGQPQKLKKKNLIRTDTTTIHSKANTEEQKI